MQKIIIVLILWINICPAFAYYNTAYNNNYQSKLKMNRPKTTVISNPAYNPQYNPSYHPYAYNSYTAGDLNALERYALDRNYRRENDIRRLERLEDLAFGAIQEGDLNTRFRNVENAILSRPKQNYKHTFWNELGNYFAGQPTGFTPSIWDNSYPSTYRNQNFEQYSNGIFGGGWGIQNNNFGTGSSVKILD